MNTVRALLLSLACALGLAAQNGVSVRGVVHDPSKSVVPGVKLTLTREGAPDAVLSAATDQDGKYRFRNIAPGKYMIRAEVNGFEPVEKEVVVGQARPPDLDLQLGIAAREQVTVTASRAEQRAAAENNADAINFDNEMLHGLPLPTESQSLINFVTDFLSPAAAGTDEVSILVDGVEGTLNIPSFAIRRVVVNRNTYSPEFRRPGKARVEVFTQDGSRRHFHGGFSMAARDSVFDARNTFAASKPDSSRRLWEAALSGPLARGVTFFLSGEKRNDHKASIINAETLTGPVRSNVLVPQRGESALGRLDFRPGQVHLLSLRYDFSQDKSSLDGVGGFSLFDQATSSTKGGQRVQISDRAIFSAEFMNDLRVAVQRDKRRSGVLSGKPEYVVTSAFTGGPTQEFRRDDTTTVDLKNIVTYVRGSHTMRFGVELRRRDLSSVEASNFGGSFEFSSLERFAQGLPYVFRANRGDPNISFHSFETHGFAQDEIRLGRGLNMMAGLRYQWQSALQDRSNLAPRLALAFSPGSQKTVLRAGAGIFYERLPDSVTKRRLLQDGVRFRELVIANPAWPDAFAGAGEAVLPPSVIRMAPGMRSPYLIQTSFSAERELWRRTLVTVEYAHLRGVSLFRARDLNAPLAGSGIRPNPAFVNVMQLESSGNMRSNAMSIAFRGRLSRRFKASANYTLSRSVNDTGGSEPGAGFPFALPANNYDLRAERGPADFDQRHRFHIAGLLELPAGFRIGTVAALTSGTPYDITTGFDDNGDTIASDRPPGITRNTARGPGFARLDLRLTKLFRIPRPANRHDSDENLEFNIDALNALNRTNYSQPVGVQSSPFFGRPTSAGAARVLQLSMEYRF